MRVLVIAPYYAPYTEVPAIRMISLSKQLVDQGHEVTVYCYSIDMLKRITDEKSLKAKIPENIRIINFDIKESKIPAFSDIVCGWHFLKALKKDISLDKYDVALCSLGPFYTLEATPYIAKKIPCILDFRDLGAISIRPKRENVKDAKSPLIKFLKKIFYKMLFDRERKAVNCASTVVVVSQPDWDIMKKTYNIPNDKLVLASNGYDEEKLKNLILKEKEENCIAGFVFGKFMYYSIERAISLVKAVNVLRKQGYKVKVKHIGQKYEWIEENLNANNISTECYEECGLMSYEEGMALLGTADFFIVEDTSPDDVGTKIYDYIYFNKPVVAATPPNIPLAKLVRTFENGYVCSTDKEVEAAMYKVVTEHPEKLDGELDPGKYSRKVQNQNIINRMLELTN